MNKDDWTIIDTSVKPGKYRGQFTGAEIVEQTFGLRTQFEFQVRGGEEDGRSVYGFTSSPPPTLRNKLGRFLAKLAGTDVEENANINPRDFIGKEYSIEVDYNEDKTNTNVKDFESLEDTPF